MLPLPRYPSSAARRHLQGEHCIVAVIHPFRALRPPAGKVEQVASVPYDVVDTVEARALAAGNPLSLLHVTRPEIDLPDDTDRSSLSRRGCKAESASDRRGR